MLLARTDALADAPSKLSPQQQAEIRKIVTKGDKTAADAARLFKVHPVGSWPGKRIYAK